MNDVVYLFIEEVFWGPIDRRDVVYTPEKHDLVFSLSDRLSRLLFLNYPESPSRVSKEVYLAEGVPICLRESPDTDEGAVTYEGSVFMNPKIPDDADMPRHENMDPSGPWTIRVTYSRRVEHD